ncbi:MAG: hypothetical protein IJ246_03475 [Clostridia bacterium]|nr:hypothetical protein [Clostridia bacterium]
MPDGLYICNQWKQIDGKWYFFGLDGYMVTSRWEGDYYLTADGTMAVSTYIDGYYVGADGKWVGNAKKKRVTPAQTQITSDGAVIATQGEWYKDSGNGRWYFIRNDGTRLKHMWAWIDSNGDGYAECYYFNKQGFMSSGAIIDGNRVNYNGKWVRNGSVQLRPVVR